MVDGQQRLAAIREAHELQNTRQDVALLTEFLQKTYDQAAGDR